MSTNFYISDILTGFVHIIKCLPGTVLQDVQTLIKKDIAAQYLPKIQIRDKNGLMLPEFLFDFMYYMYNSTYTIICITYKDLINCKIEDKSSTR